MNKLSVNSKKSLLVRTITAIVFVAILFPCTLYGDWPFFIMMVFLSVVGTYEVIHAAGAHRYPIYIQIVVYLFVLSFIYWTFIKNSIQYQKIVIADKIYLNEIFVSILGIILYALILFLFAIFNSKFELNDVTYLFTIGIVFALGMQGILFIRYFPASSGAVNYANSNIGFISDKIGSTTPANYFKDYYVYFDKNSAFSSSLLMFFTFVGTFMSDVGAYLFGMLFGKHHMSPRISPHKTWEGFFGGMIVSILCSLSFAAIMEYCFNLPLVPGIIQFQNSDLLKFMGVLNGTAWPFITLIAIMMPVVGNVGGFLYSLIKRHFGIKDYGKLLPGHGGVIDRFDSTMINSIMMAILILLTANGWNLTI